MPGQRGRHTAGGGPRRGVGLSAEGTLSPVRFATRAHHDAADRAAPAGLYFAGIESAVGMRAQKLVLVR